MSDPRVSVVEAGYDAIADTYLDWTGRISGDPKLSYARSLLERLPEGARVLELGCGAGQPCTQALAAHLDVTGVDISARQIERARANVPTAHFVRDDFMRISLAPSSFDAVAAFYSLNHVPRERLGDLLRCVHGWLRDGGLFLASLDVSDTDSWTGDWLGTTMFFSGWSCETSRELLTAAGFELLVDELVTVVEPPPDGEVTFQWVLARR